MSNTQNVHVATDLNFDAEVLPAAQLTMVDFWAEWCPPCRALSPTIEKIADDYAGKVKVFKMNVDENQTTPAKFQVRGIPTVIFLKDGKLVDQMVGNLPREAILKTVEKHLS